MRGDAATSPTRRGRGARGWIIPARVKEYTFYVDGAPASVRVPADFSDNDFDEIVIGTFFKDRRAFDAHVRRAREAGRLGEDEPEARRGQRPVLT